MASRLASWWPKVVAQLFHAASWSLNQVEMASLERMSGSFCGCLLTMSNSCSPSSRVLVSYSISLRRTPSFHCRARRSWCCFKAASLRVRSWFSANSSRSVRWRAAMRWYRLRFSWTSSLSEFWAAMDCRNLFMRSSARPRSLMVFFSLGVRGCVVCDRSLGAAALLLLACSRLSVPSWPSPPSCRPRVLELERDSGKLDRDWL